MKKRQFIRILQKYREGTATPEEKEMIDSYYDLFEMESEGEAHAHPDRRRELKQQALGSIWERIRDMNDVVAMKRHRISPRAWKIAAAVLALVAAGFLVYLKPFGHRPQDNTLAVDNEAGRSDSIHIHPGGHHAVLTLAGGVQVVLDSAQSGLLASQGNSQVIKLANGRLVYREDASRRRSGEVFYNTVTTPRGGEYQVTLPDGSKVWLNAGSSLRMPTAFTGNTRSVEITGEAYFEIDEEPDRPFIVKSGDMIIEVLGTYFNINAYPDEAHMEATLTKGSIRVSTAGISRVLKPGQRADMDRQTGNIEVDEANVDQVLAWKNGLFYFDNTNIKEIMREISRWYNVNVVYQGDGVDQNTFSGVVSRYGDVEALLERLELTGTVHFTIDGTQITVSG